MNLNRKIFSFLLLFVFTSIAFAQLAWENTSSIMADSNDEYLNEDFKAPRTDLLRTNTGDFIYGPATRIKFKIIEEESGIASTFFKVADFPYMKSDGRQMMPHDLEDGSYEMRYYSVDNEGNQEQIRTDNIYLDKQGPEVSSSFNVAPLTFEEGIPVFPEDVEVVINISDKKVEVQKVVYTINDGPNIESKELTEINLTEQLKGLESEIIKVKVTAYDVFYNMSKEVIEFKISR